jgi:hypothetical protein
MEFFDWRVVVFPDLRVKIGLWWFLLNSPCREAFKNAWKNITPKKTGGGWGVPVFFQTPCNKKVTKNAIENMSVVFLSSSCRQKRHKQKSHTKKRPFF